MQWNDLENVVCKITAISMFDPIGLTRSQVWGRLEGGLHRIAQIPIVQYQFRTPIISSLELLRAMETILRGEC